MKLKRSTVALVGVALLMGAGVLVAESQRGNAPQTAEVEGTGEPIFPFEESAVTRLQVARDGETLVFEKDGDGNWQMVEPDSGPAEPGAVAFLLSRLNTDSPLQTVAMQPDEVEDFGFSDPAGTVTVTLEDGTEHRLLLGGEDFSGSARYAVIDPETWPPAADAAEEISVLVVSQDVANGINRPVDEWQMPVEAATDTNETPDEVTEDADTEMPEDSAEASEASETVEDSPEEAAPTEETEPSEDAAPAANTEPTAESEDDAE